MKNKFYLGLIGVGCGLLFLTGCGSSNKVTCTATQEEDGKKMSAEIVATLDGDKVKSVAATLEFDSEETASQYYGFISLANAFAEEGGEKIDAKLDGKKIVVNNYEKMSEQGEIAGLTKDEFIKKMEADEAGFKCK